MPCAKWWLISGVLVHACYNAIANHMHSQDKEFVLMQQQKQCNTTLSVYVMEIPLSILHMILMATGKAYIHVLVCNSIDYL